MKIRILICFLILLSFILIKNKYDKSVNLEKRVQNIEILCEAYLKYAKTNSTPPQIEKLYSILTEQGVNFFKPGKNSDSFYYQLHPLTNIDIEHTPDFVIIEEMFNDNNEQIRIKAYSDGSIRFLKGE
ncbi:MAG: hypothetical protein IJU47_05140 [Verrucomicrobia bacterium]|nr:hypothetical protein [Verrucomicrobiota bacterium]